MGATRALGRACGRRSAEKTPLSFSKIAGSGTAIRDLRTAKRVAAQENRNNAPTLVKSTNLLDFCTCFHRQYGSTVSFN
jgi:hypothetical protein